MANDETSLEEMMARGEILEIGEVVIEEEELEIPVFVEEQANPEDDFIDRSRLPDLVIYKGPPPKAQPDYLHLESRAGLYSASSVKVCDAQKRLEQLAERMLGEEKAGNKVARIFGRTTERDRLKAFGEYFAGFLGKNQESSTGYISPEQFLVKAEMALINLQAGIDGGRPLRKSVRDALSGKDESVYNSIRQKLPQIARAVATTGFAVELNQIYDDASRVGRKTFDYANDIRRERQIDNISRRLIREGLK